MKTDEDFIKFLQKELVDMIYNKEIDGDDMKVYNKIVAKWRKKNEKEESSRQGL